MCIYTYTHIDIGLTRPSPAHLGLALTPARADYHTQQHDKNNTTNKQPHEHIYVYYT